MERSSAGPPVRTARPVPPKSLKKINVADPHFLSWFQGHQPPIPLDEGRKLFLEEVNVRRKAKYDKHLEEYQIYLDSPRNEDQIPNPTSPDQSPSHSRLMSLKKSAVININTTFSQSIPSQSSSPQNNLPQIHLSQSSLPQNNLPQISPSQSSLPQDDPLSPTAPNQRVRAISEATGLRLARTKPSGFIFWSTLSEIIYALLVD